MKLTQQFLSLFPQGLCGFIFDCDGVLVDSDRVNIRYYNKILQELGKEPMTREEEIYVQMASVSRAFEHITTEEDRAKLPEILERIPYVTHALPALELYPDLKVFLEALKEMGFHLAVHTNRGSGMKDVLNQFDLNHLFCPVMTANIVAPKPHPEGIFRILEDWDTTPERVLFVGDSKNDYYASKAAKVPFAAFNNPKLDSKLHITSYKECLASLKEAFAHWKKQS